MAGALVLADEAIVGGFYMTNMCSRLPEESIEDVPGLKITQRSHSSEAKGKNSYGTHFIVKMNVADAAEYLKKEVGPVQSEEIVNLMQERYDQERKDSVRKDQRMADLARKSQAEDSDYKIVIQRSVEELEMEEMRDDIKG